MDNSTKQEYENENLDSLVTQVLDKIDSKERFIVGIAGSPASGKSTLARTLIRGINERAGEDVAVLLPMDGFHKSNEELVELGLLALKGIPASFDAEGFVDLLEAVQSHANETHFAPEFKREIEASIPASISILPKHQLVITEGNYLLLDEAPWDRLKYIIDEVYYIEINEELRLKRLKNRHMKHGRSQVETEMKIAETDEPNARLIEASRKNADGIIRF